MIPAMVLSRPENAVSECSAALGEDSESEDCCWVCLGCASPSAPLVRPCCCPRTVHATCIARWQLQSAGTRRETRCEFCSQELPNWRSVLTPPTGLNLQGACMNVNFFSKVYSFKVTPGPQGYQEFTSAIRKSFSLPSDSELNITFTCDEPSTGSLLTLQGAGAYDAAVYCAAISAARRQADGDSHRGPHGPLSAGAAGKHHGSLLSIELVLQKARRLASPINAVGKRLKSAFSDVFLWGDIVAADVGTANKLRAAGAPMGAPNYVPPDILPCAQEATTQEQKEHNRGLHELRPDALLITRHPDIRHRQVHIVEIKCCKDTAPAEQLERAKEQHEALIGRLEEAGFSNIIHLTPTCGILIEVSGTSYREHMLQQLTLLGLSKASAAKLHRQSISDMHSIVQTRRVLEHNANVHSKSGDPAGT